MRWEAGLIDTGAARLHVRRVVEPTATPLILLHGLGVGGVVWQAFARRLLPAFAAVAPDLRGHAESEPAPARSGYTPSDYAHDIAGLISILGPTSVPVLGHSLGSLVGLRLAADHPNLVSALVLVDPPVDPELSNPDIEQVYTLRHEPLGRLETYLREGNPGGGELLAATLASLFRRAEDRAFETLLAEPAGRRWAWEAASSVRAPVLVVQGDPHYGGMLGDEAAHFFARRFPDGRLLKIPSASHSVHASHPAELARAALDFLDAVPFAQGASSSPSSSSV